MIPDLPAFLIIPQSERAAAWKGHKFTRQGSGFRAQPTKVEEAATRKLRRQLEQQRQEQIEAKRIERREKGCWK